MRLQGPRLKEIEQILLVESHKLDPTTIWWGPKPKKWQIEAKPTWHNLEGKSIGSYPKKRAQRRAHDLENKDEKLGSKTWFNSRIQFASNESKDMVQLKDSSCFKWVQTHGSTQGFNLLQMSPNTWFNSRIQFASNESLDMVQLKDSICFKWVQIGS
jgi:hypothetical protein